MTTSQEQLDIQKENEAITARNLARSSGDSQAYLGAGGVLSNGAIPTLQEGTTEETFNKFQDRYSRVTPTTPQDTQYTQAENILSSPLQTQSVEEIQAEKTKAAQAQIDALNRTYQDKLAAQTTVNEGQERRTSSVNTLTGLAGSTEAGVQAKKTEDVGNKQLDAIRNEQAVMVQSILTDISNSAIEEARQQTLDARASAEDVLAMRTQRQSDVVDKIGVLSQTGATLEGLQGSMSPEDYNYLVSNAGGEEMLKGYLALNRPVESIIDKRVENGKYIIAYQNPITGETRIETTDLGIPTGYSKTLDAGDRILAIPDDWGGDPADLITINKGLTPAQTQSAMEEVTPETNISELDPTSQSILAQTGLSIPAFSFLTTGTSALTRMTANDRKKYMAEAEEWAIKNNIDTSIFQAEYNAQTDIVEQYTKRAAAVDLRGDDIMLSLDMLKGITEEAGFGDLRIKNVAKIWAGKEVNDPVAQQYAYNLEDLRSAVAGFFAVQEGRNMTTVDDSNNAKELIANGLATGSIQGLIDTIETVKERTTAISNQAARNAQASIWEMFGVNKPTGEEDQTVDIQEVNGVKYQKGEDGLYYPIK